ncbi:MAG: holo-ACP synthase [Nitrospirota bacterium]
MIYGIGIDLVKIERVKSVVNKWGQKFLEKVFTGNEIAYCYERKEPYLSLSVRFAAKEAFIKAIGSEIFLPLTTIEIMNNKSGVPSIRIKGEIKKFFKKNKLKHCHLSLSHEKEFGIACVVLEK